MSKHRQTTDIKPTPDEREACAGVADEFVPDVPREYQHTQDTFNLYKSAQIAAAQKIAADIRAR